MSFFVDNTSIWDKEITFKSFIRTVSSLFFESKMNLIMNTF